MVVRQHFDPQEMGEMIGAVLGAVKAQRDQAALKRGEAAVSRLAYILSDDYADRADPADLTTKAVREIIRRTKETLSDSERVRLQDMIDVALARVDLKHGLQYFLKDENGNAINLTSLQCFELDFCRYCEEEVLVSVIFAPMGSGKSFMLVGRKAWEIGRNVNILEQLVCSSDGPAMKRGMAIQALLESPHYRKVFPHVRPDMRKWANHEFLVKRTKMERGADVRRDTRGDAGAIDFTVVCYGVTASGLGSRADYSDFDDLATYENSIKNPADSVHIKNILTLKWFTRQKSPVGVDDRTYDKRNDPWRGRVIGTPWAHDDPIYSLRDWEGAAVALIGVNDDVTAYNVQIWGLPDHRIELLRKKYAHKTVEFGELPPDLYEFCVENKLPTAPTYTLGPGKAKDQLNPPKATMEIPLSRPRQWYLNKLKTAEDPKQDFDRPYRCQVYAEGELAFPDFQNTLYVGWNEDKEKKIYKPVRYDEKRRPDVEMQIVKEPVLMNRDGEIEQVGWRAYMLNPPKDSPYMISMVDLAGKNRPGTAILTSTLTPEHRRRVIEVEVLSVSGGQTSTRIDALFARYDKQLIECNIETVSLQSMFVEEMEKHKTEYPWWTKISHFKDTATSKNDEHIGLQVSLGTTFAKGGFELPDTWRMAGHGPKCPCGYCRIIRDASTQTRLAECKSDVLICCWGVHLRMPHSFELGEPLPPSGHRYAETGYALMEPGDRTPLGHAVYGTRPRTYEQEEKCETCGFDRASCEADPTNGGARPTHEFKPAQAQDKSRQKKTGMFGYPYQTARPKRADDGWKGPGER